MRVGGQGRGVVREVKGNDVPSLLKFLCSDLDMNPSGKKDQTHQVWPRSVHSVPKISFSRELNGSRLARLQKAG